MIQDKDILQEKIFLHKIQLGSSIRSCILGSKYILTYHPQVHDILQYAEQGAQKYVRQQTGCEGHPSLKSETYLVDLTWDHPEAGNRRKIKDNRPFSGPQLKSTGQGQRTRDLISGIGGKNNKDQNHRLPRIKSSIDEEVKDLNIGLEIGIFSAQGRRPYQEDEYAINPLLNRLVNSGENLPETHLFAVFDGHAGGKCSKTISTEFPEILCRDPAFKSKLPVALRSCFQKSNENFLKIAEKMRLNDGSTGIVCVLRGRRLVIGNVGDSRAILLTGRKPVQLSTDHKPSSPEEMRRIIALGGTVVNCMGVPRVNGILAVARAFGNYGIRHVIKAEPDIFQRDVTAEDDFIVLASDGMWDVLRNKDVCDICYSLKGDGATAQRVAEELVRTALARGSMDNITCMVVAMTGYFARLDTAAVEVDEDPGGEGVKSSTTGGDNVQVPVEREREREHLNALIHSAARDAAFFNKQMMQDRESITGSGPGQGSPKGGGLSKASNGNSNGGASRLFGQSDFQGSGASSRPTNGNGNVSSSLRPMMQSSFSNGGFAAPRTTIGQSLANVGSEGGSGRRPMTVGTALNPSSLYGGGSAGNSNARPARINNTTLKDNSSNNSVIVSQMESSAGDIATPPNKDRDKTVQQSSRSSRANTTGIDASPYSRPISVLGPHLNGQTASSRRGVATAYTNNDGVMLKESSRLGMIQQQQGKERGRSHAHSFDGANANGLSQSLYIGRATAGERGHPHSLNSTTSSSALLRASPSNGGGRGASASTSIVDHSTSSNQPTILFSKSKLAFALNR
eukprot:gene10827-22588_t